MPQIDRMPNTGTNAGRHQALMVMIGANFRQASELGEVEVRAGANIEKDAGRKSSPAGIQAQGLEYSVTLRHGPVRAPMPIHMVIHAGTRTRNGERTRA